MDHGKLELCLEDPRRCLDENICHNLLNFKVSVVKHSDLMDRSRATKILAMFGGSLEGGLKILLQRSEEVHLEHVMGLRNSFEINNGEVEFASLTNLRIESCENVEHLARVPPNPRQIHQPVKSFSKLSELIIKGSSFKYLFCASIAKCLVQLEEVCIDDCREMEQIVRNDSPIEEDNEIIDFPKLKSMNLRQLPNLRSFCSQKRNISLTPTDNTADVPVHSLFNGMVALSALRKLEIYGLDNVQTLFNEKTLEEDSFCQLKILEVRWCEKLENVFRTSGARALVHLEELYIEGCPRMKTIIAADENREQVINHRIEFFPMLKKLKLWDLPLLNSFWCPESVEPNINRPASYSSHKVVLPRLEEIVISDVTINAAEISMSRDDMDDSTSQRPRTLKLASYRSYFQVIPLDWLQDLEILTLNQSGWKGLDLFDLLGHSLRNNNNDPCGIPSFAKLKVIEVSWCGLLTLFPYSVFRNLQTMEKIEVQNCDLIEEIVSGDEVAATGEDIPIFQLKSIELLGLPSLKSFCGSTEFAAFNMPSLEQVTLAGCPRMLNFTSQQISTPSVNIRFTWSARYIGFKEDTTDDLNKYIQQQIEERRTNKKWIEEQWSEDEDEDEDEMKFRRTSKNWKTVKADGPEGSASKEKGKGIMKPDDV